MLAAALLAALLPGVASAAPSDASPPPEPTAAAPTAVGSPLLANLWTMAPEDFRIVQEGQRRRLRVTVASVNVGVGPVEVKARKKDCDGDGSFENDRTAFQHVYQDADGDGAFRRSVDTTFSTVRVGCFRFDEHHQHWHFKNFARFELARMSDGQVVSAHEKVGFCLLDSDQPYPGIPGSPTAGYYRSCQPDKSQGLSAGWSDVYDANLPGQFVDVTNVPDGDYCFSSTVNPARRLVEAEVGDNTATLALRLEGESVTPLSRDC
jgi:hypothetical protein